MDNIPEKAFLEDSDCGTLRKTGKRQLCTPVNPDYIFLWVKKVDFKPETLFKELIIRSLLLLGLEISQKQFLVMIALFLVSMCKAQLSANFIS